MVLLAYAALIYSISSTVAMRDLARSERHIIAKLDEEIQDSLESLKRKTSA
ncbi:hypothetical protein VB002_05415 [Campylobacter concisus]